MLKSLPKILLLTILLIVVGFLFLFFQKSNSITASYVYLDTHSVFVNNLELGWENWSWNSSADFSNGTITFNANPWSGLYLHRNTTFNYNQFSHIEFKVKSSNENSNFRILIADNSNILTENNLDLKKYKYELLQDGWKKYIIGLSELNSSGALINGFAFQETSGQNSQFKFDDIRLVKLGQSEELLTADNSIVYENKLAESWKDWSWGGSAEKLEYISFYHSAWAGLYLRSTQKINLPQFNHLQLKVKVKDSGINYKVALYDNQNNKLRDFINLSNYGGELNQEWKTYTIPLSDLATNSQEAYGIVFHNGTERSNILYVDDIKLLNTPNLPANTVTQNSFGYTVTNNQIFKNGQKVVLKGVNWFGAETETLSPHGLWSRNYKDMIQQIKASGFNAVRMPFCPATLTSASVSGIEYSLNRDLEGLNSSQLFDKIINELNSQQVYVLLDHHRPDCQAISPLWTTGNYTENQWISDLVEISSRYKHLEYVLGVDLKNEPHGNATWGTGNAATDWNKAAERAGKAVLNSNPNILLFIQGIQDQSSCSSTIGHWMGGNIEPLDCAPIDTNFIPANKLVLSPHVYGPDVYPQGYFNESNYPQNLPAIWNQHFGRFIQKGYTLVPGEWGGKYGEGDPRDIAWQKEIVNYFKQNKICNSFYWSWNPNSSDTGGILRDDWKSVRTDKLQLLSDYFSNCN